ncbi:MAG: glycoside hydrolase family 3 C-terminal domain-containing protein [Anaerolineales bacterium]|nr:glycoside hydrolase family 3 C-terminal domain-containing protein [Anaerolineales bacterium]
MKLPIDEIINQMSLAEKAALCTGASNWSTVPVERLGVPALVVSDGPHGVRRVVDDTLGASSQPATCFPTASSLAATWNRDLIKEMGRALAEECIALGVDVILGPGANMKRTPLCGRNFEYFSEDPYLAGELAAAFINAVQSQGVGTSLKHYAANNQEYQRFRIDVRIDERTLHEIYLPAFERAVKQAQPWTVMCAYNKVNGTYASEHFELLTRILKQDWSLAGLVVSDWGAVHDRVASLQGGLDLEMPGPKDSRVQAVIQAVENGKLEQAVLDESVRRILTVIEKAKATPKGSGTFDTQAHHALARRIASEGIVLLKNDGLLPLQDPQTIAVIGRTAKEAHFQGGGSSHINPTLVDVPFVELQKLAGQAELRYAEGYPETPEFKPELIAEAVAVAQEAEVALLYIGLPGYIESEGYDRQDLDLTPQQVALIKAVAAVQPKTVVILNNGSAVSMVEWQSEVAAILEAWLMGQAGGGAIAEVLFGKVNPSGKLAESYPLKLQDTPAYLHFPGGAGQVHYGEGLYIGYRYYDTKAVPVLYPFGHGLSYTTFEYRHPTVSQERFTDQDSLVVAVDVCNTGQLAGAEIVQVYVHDLQAELDRPVKELKGFAKVYLEPGETKTVQIELEPRAFAYYHPGYHDWIAESGEFDLLIAASALDIRARLRVTLASTRELPCLLDEESTIGEWLADGRGKEVFEPIYQMMLAQMGAILGESGDDQADIGMDMQRFLHDMPLRSILHFQESALPMPADEIVAMLLGRVHGGVI